MKSCTPVAVVAACLLLCGTAYAVQDCEMNGESVNPANGSTYAGKTGIMKCRDRDSGKLVREEEYRNGRAIGYRKFTDMWGKTTVANYNENGNRDGESKEYDPAGTLIAQERYANGEHVGLQTYYHANGKVRRRSFHEGKGNVASIEYNDRGQLTQLRCADKPLLGDDRALCGFDGKASDLTFYNAKGDASAKTRYENGKRVAFTAFNAGGAPARSDEMQGERRVSRDYFPDGKLRSETIFAGGFKQSERELAQSGQPLREAKWQQGRMAEETLWYLNGQPKSRTRWSGEGSYVQQIYDDAGMLRTEATYEKDRIARRKTYKDGKLVSDEELFEDGSRKSMKKPE